MSNVTFSAYVLNYPLIKSSFISNSIFPILALQVKQIYNTPLPPLLPWCENLWYGRPLHMSEYYQILNSISQIISKATWSFNFDFSYYLISLSIRAHLRVIRLLIINKISGKWLQTGNALLMLRIFGIAMFSLYLKRYLQVHNVPNVLIIYIDM